MRGRQSFGRNGGDNMVTEEYVTRNLPVSADPDELVEAVVTDVDEETMTIELSDGRTGTIPLGVRSQYDSWKPPWDVPRKWEPGMKVRRIVISKPAGERPHPSRCVRCEGGPIDVVNEKTVCRDCGQSNGDAGSLNYGFSFIFRK